MGWVIFVASRLYICPLAGQSRVNSKEDARVKTAS